MIDAVGIGETLLNFGLLVAILIFIVTVFFLRAIFKLSLFYSVIVGFLVSIAIFISSPKIFLLLVQVSGYSY